MSSTPPPSSLHTESPEEEVGEAASEAAAETAPEAAPEPGSVKDYSDELLPAPLRKALLAQGFERLTSVQQAVVSADTHSRDLRISSQTGSGKTVAVGIALGRELLRLGSRRDQAQARSEIDGASKFDPRAPQVLLLTPTRELASQVQRELVWLFGDVPDAFVEVVTGGTSVGMERKALSRGPRMIVGTPGRVLDHLNRGGFVGDQVTQVVLDEADQMLDMGFRDELQAILELLPGRSRTHLVSATFSGEIRRIAERYQTDAAFLEGSALGAANEDIQHIAHVVGFRHRYDALINVLLSAQAERSASDGGRTLIFTRTRADCLEIAERLQQDGLRAEPLSGDLAQAQRTRTLSAFRSGRVTTIVATDVAARGLDVQGVDLVVHLDPPENADAYTHRSGRTGRAGRKGTTILFMPPQARGRIERLLHLARVKPQWAPVPTADKVKKLYMKLGRRRLYESLDVAVSEDQVDYARKLLEGHAAEQVVARLLPFMDVRPPCPPREISEAFAPRSSGGGHRHDPRARGGEGRSRPDPRGRPERRGGPRHETGAGAGRSERGPRRAWRGPGKEAPSGDGPATGPAGSTPRRFGAKKRSFR